MNYKQNMLFVAKCLTLDQHPEKVEEVRNEIKGNLVNWENVVKLSSGKLVMPAMYLQLKRNGLIGEIPVDLAEYLEYITELNRERNKAILQQVNDITALLNAHNIYPVFLKGVANLLSGLYNDMAERMIGDIDFLVSENEMIKAANILISHGYQPKSEYKTYMFRELKHYPRMQNFSYPAAVEIHKEVLRSDYMNLFRGSRIMMSKQPVPLSNNMAFVPSLENMVIHNVLNAQLNDKAYINGDILLRQMYDLYQLSLKEGVDILMVAAKFDKKFKMFNAYFVAIDFLFSYPKGIKYRKSKRTGLYLKRLNLFLLNPSIHRAHRTVVYLSDRFSRYIKLPLYAVFQKDTRIGLFRRITDYKWYGNHFESYRKFFRG